MQHVRLGNSGLQVSRLCLGTMTFGAQCDEPLSLRILDRALEAGISFIDTADCYPLASHVAENGRTEEILGRWLHGRRERVVLATKCNMAMGDLPWQRGSSRRHLMQAIDASLTRLGTDYVDLYQLHFPDPDTPIDETLRALDDLVRAGKVRYVGLSNFAAWRLARAIGRAEVLGTVVPVSAQPRYNLLFRAPERELLPLCAEEGMAVIPYNPLAGGLLTGKHRGRSKPRDGTRFTLQNSGKRYQERYWQATELDAVERLATLSAEAGVLMPQLAIGWLLAQPAVTAPILGASQPEQLDAGLAALETPLTPDLLGRLDELTAGFRASDADR